MGGFRKASADPVSTILWWRGLVALVMEDPGERVVPCLELRNPCDRNIRAFETDFETFFFKFLTCKRKERHEREKECMGKEGMHEK